MGRSCWWASRRCSRLRRTALPRSANRQRLGWADRSGRPSRSGHRGRRCWQPFGPALIARGLPAGRLLWARTDALGARLWAVEQALRCASVAAVLAWLPAARAGGGVAAAATGGAGQRQTVVRAAAGVGAAGSIASAAAPAAVRRRGRCDRGGPVQAARPATAAVAVPGNAVCAVDGAAQGCIDPGAGAQAGSGNSGSASSGAARSHAIGPSVVQLRISDDGHISPRSSITTSQTARTRCTGLP